MKKFFTLIAAALLGMTASAQEGTYYLQNVESGLFLSGANSWGTQASATINGEQFYIAPVGEGVYTLTGTLLNSANKTLGYNLYVDTNTSQNGNQWTIAPVAGEEGVYTLYGEGKKDNVEGAYAGYVAQGTEPGAVIGYPCVGATTITDAAKWRFLTKEQAIANLKNGDNVTFLFDNANFTRNRVASTKDKKTMGPWKISEECTSANLYGGANNNTCAESYHSLFNIYQTVTDLPNGTYIVKAQGFYRNDGEGSVNVPVFYANEATKEFFDVTVDGKAEKDDNHTVKKGDVWIPNSMANASNLFTQGIYTIDEFEVEVTDGSLTLGVKNETEGNIWCIWDNFQVVLKEIAKQDEYTVYAKVSADGQSKTFVGQVLKVATLNGVATVTLPAAQAGPYTMESQKVQVAISEEGAISMIEGQTLNFKMGETPIVVTVTSVEGTLADEKVNVTVSATGDNGKDVKVIYSTDEIVEPTSLVWDFAEYTEKLVLADENKTVEYKGLTLVGNDQAGYTSDYVSAAAGFHMNGTSNATTRHIVYTPTENGKMTVTYRSNNATATDRITAIGTEVVKSSDLATLLANEKVLAAGLTDGAELKTIEADLVAGTTYYIYFASGGQSIMKLEFTTATDAPVVKSAEKVAEKKVIKYFKDGKVIIGNVNAAGQLIK